MPGRRQAELPAATEHCCGGTCVERAGHKLGGLRASPGPATLSLGLETGALGSQSHRHCSQRVLPALALGDVDKTLSWGSRGRDHKGDVEKGWWFYCLW